MSNLVISVRNLTKRFGDFTAVDSISFDVSKGEIFGFLGANGAGKTTTIKMLTCLAKPTEGDAYVGGYSITMHPERVREVIGVSPQETAVAPNLTVKENLELICGIHGFTGQ